MTAYKHFRRTSIQPYKHFRHKYIYIVYHPSSVQPCHPPKSEHIYNKVDHVYNYWMLRATLVILVPSGQHVLGDFLLLPGLLLLLSSVNHLF
jgi:hypothetical protein